MSYTYTDGQGVAVLLVTEPADSEIFGASMDESLRQIISYLQDPTVGPEAKYQSLLAQFNTIKSQFGSSQGLPPGMILPMAGTIPTGWFACTGGTGNRTTDAALFANIGVNFGNGNGTTTFGLPDLQGYTLCAPDMTLTTNNFALPLARFGEVTHTLTLPEGGVHSHYRPNRTEQFIARTDTNPTLAFPLGGVHISPLSTDSKGSGGAHNNMQPSLAMNFAIRK